MRMGNFDDFVRFDDYGRIVRGIYDGASSPTDAPVTGGVQDDEPTNTPLPVGGTFVGASDFTGDVDRYTVSLLAGHTYLFSLKGSGPNALNDTYLELINPGFTAFLGHDDDGGNALNSMLTYTATADGVYFLRARAFANTGDPGIGGYTIDIRDMGADAVGDTNASAGTLAIGGSVFGFRESGTDVDRYAVQLEAGKFYTFQVAGGSDYETNLNAVPAGELDTILVLRDGAGNIIFVNDDNGTTDPSSGLGYSPTVGGTYYLDVTAYPGNTGGYELISSQPVTVAELAALDPLDSIRWVNANNIPTVDVNGDAPGGLTAYVYFASAADGAFGETEATDDFPPGTLITTYGWSALQQAAVMTALQTQYTPITGITYAVTTDVTQATFRMMTTINDDYGARFRPQDPSNGSLQGNGIFNLASGGFQTDPNSLLPGGYAYSVILHEFGHGHGLAHPHDTGGGSDVMVGVTGNGSLGVFNLNQAVYTVMSYNDGYVTHPDGTRTYAVATRDSGWTETLSAFDIAALQERYGVHAANTGNTVYTLADTQAEASYQTIWDTGGTDTIAYNGTQDSQIDLLAATLDYSPTGGGVISYARTIFGGFSIAHDVVIENATGGSGNDVLLGNSANNVLTGNAGNDTLWGREGLDTASYTNASGGVAVNLAAGTATGADGNDTLNSIENVIGSAYADRIIGDSNVNRIAGGNGLDVITLAGGNDVFVAEIGSNKVVTKAGIMSVDIITDFDANGNDLIDVSGFGQTFHFHGTSANKNVGDLTYKTYTSINGAENALGFDIDGNPGASGVGGPVTVVYGNVDGDKPDFMIVLLGTANVEANDFIYG